MESACDGDLRTQLVHAICNKSVSEVKSLLNCLTNVEMLFEEFSVHYDIPLLRLAVETQCIDMVKLLLEYGIDVNAIDVYGRTALFDAARTNNMDCVKLLIDYGVNVNHVDDCGLTAAHKAIDHESTEILKYLLSHGLQIEQQPRGRAYNLFIHAVENIIEDPRLIDHEAIKHKLKLDKRVSLLCKYYKGASPTHYNELRDITMWCAVWHGEYDIPALLIKNGACVRQKSCCGDDADGCATGTLLMDVIVGTSNPYDNDIYYSCQFLVLVHQAGGDISEEKISRLANRCPDPRYVEMRRMLSEFLKRPRSLMDLCRLAVRDAMQGNLVTSVQTLRIPVSLQQYLVFSEFVITDTMKRLHKERHEHFGI